MSNPFSEDTLIEQPAIQLFKSVLGRPSTNKATNARIGELRSFIRAKFVDGSLWDKITPRI